MKTTVRLIVTIVCLLFYFPVFSQGSLAKVKAEALNIKVAPRIDQGLDGLIVGLSTVPNKTAGINLPKYFQSGPRITIHGEPDPNFVLDNFNYVGDLGNINPDDISESVLLKDATSASIHGARGGNGVLLFNLKNSEYNAPTKITVHNYTTLGGKTNLMSIDAMSPSSRIDMDAFLFAHNFTRPYEQNRTTQALSPALEEFLKWKRKEITFNQLEEQLNIWRQLDIRKEISRDYYQTPLSNHFWAEVSGGEKKINYRVSLGIDDGRTSVKTSRDARKTLGLTGGFKMFADVVEVKFGGNGSVREQYNINDIEINSTIYGQLKDGSGKNMAFPFQYRQSILDSMTRLGYLDGSYYWKTELDERDQTLTNNNLRGRVNIILKSPDKFIKGLEVSFNTQYQVDDTRWRDLKHQQTYDAREITNRYTQKTATGLERLVEWGNILDISNTTIKARHTRWQVNYARNIPNSTFFSIMAGFETSRIVNQSSNSLVYNFSDINPQGQTNIDYSNPYPTSYPSNSVDRIPGAVAGKVTTRGLVSYYSAFSFQYKDRLHFSVTGRYDQSNVFGKTTNRAYIPLASAGVSWEVHKEHFYKPAALLPDLLKIRLTAGILGNIAGTATLFPTITSLGYNLNGDRMSAVTNRPLDVLRWEKVNTYNFGVDFTFAKGVLSGTLDYLQKRSRDLVGPTPVDPTIGNSTIVGNYGKINAHQIDISLNSQILKRNITWSGKIFLTYIKESVVKYSDMLRPAWEYCEGGYLSAVTGQAPYSIFSFQYLDLDNTGNPIGILNKQESQNYGGILTEEGYYNLICNGRSTPALYGTLTNVFGWRRFELTAALAYKLLYYYRRPSINYSDIQKGIGLGSKDMERRWQRPGDELVTYIPAMIYPANSDRDLFFKYSSRLVEKGDHVRLQYITLSYWLNQDWVRKLLVKSCSIYVNVSNLPIIWRAGSKEFDPDRLAGYLTGSEYRFGLLLNIK